MVYFFLRCNTQDDDPYEGVKVLDLSQGIAGPYCAMHFARNGADVELEPPGMDVERQLGARRRSDSLPVTVHRENGASCRFKIRYRIRNCQAIGC